MTRIKLRILMAVMFASIMAAVLYAQGPIGNLRGTTRTRGSISALSVEIVDSSGNQISSFGGSGGTASVDDSAFTVGTTTVTPAGGIYRSVLDSVDDGDTGAFAMLANRIQMVHMVDATGAALSVGGGTQYANGSAQATPTGTVALGWDGANVRALSTSAAGVLNVALSTVPSHAVTNAGTFVVQESGAALTALQLIDNPVGSLSGGAAGTSSFAAGGIYNTVAPTLTNGQQAALQLSSSGALIVTGAAGTTQYAEDAAHASGDQMVFIGGIRRDTTPSSSAGTAGDYTAFNIDANGRLYVNAALYDASGNAITSTDVQEDAAETAGAFGPSVMSVRRDTAASSAGTSGDNATFNTDANGLLWSRQLDPCNGTAKSVFPVNISSAATTEITPSLAGASTNYYVCAINLVTAAANNVALVDDDTDNCASVTSGLAGGTTAASGWNFGANGGLTLGNGDATVAKTNGTNRVLCLVTSAATQLSGTIVVAAAP